MSKWLKHKRLDAVLDSDRVIYLNPQFKVRRTVGSLAHFGITPEQYEAMLKAQDGVCATCSKPCKTNRWLCVDHDHDTGMIRGLLCSKCNTAIGLLNDDVDIMCNVLDYMLKDR